MSLFYFNICTGGFGWVQLYFLKRFQLFSQHLLVLVVVSRPSLFNHSGHISFMYAKPAPVLFLVV
jgi:hypothetical protein